MFTRSGLGAAIAAIVLVVCGVWWRYEELLVAGVAVAVAVAVAEAGRPGTRRTAPSEALVAK